MHASPQSPRSRRTPDALAPCFHAHCAFEPRYAACIAWGAQWDYYDTWKKRFDLLDSGTVPSLSVPPEHLMWVFGVKTRAEAMKKLEGFRLDGIVQKMRCPFLVTHGADDEQVPLADAQSLYDAVGNCNGRITCQCRVSKKQEGKFVATKPRHKIRGAKQGLQLP